MPASGDRQSRFYSFELWDGFGDGEMVDEGEGEGPWTGCQLGFSSTAPLDVSRIGPLPSAFMIQMSRLPDRVLTNAIFRPSGEQAGNPSNAEFVLNRILLPPPEATLQISMLAAEDRFDARTTLLPLADQEDSPSIRLVPVSLASPEPSAFMTQTSEDPPRLLVNEMCAPSGDQAGVKSSDLSDVS